MKKSVAQLTGFIFWILTASVSHAFGSPLEAYRMSGICQLQGDWIVSISNAENGRRLWLRIGQSIEGLQFNSFDAETNTATLLYENEEFKLTLHDASDCSQAVARSEPLNQNQHKEIQDRVKEYQAGLQVLLREPADGPRSPKAQAKLKQDLANMVANYRDSLLTELTEQENATESSVSETKRNNISAKRRNRVNSRIWASDHIEKHGHPIE